MISAIRLRTPKKRWLVSFWLFFSLHAALVYAEVPYEVDRTRSVFAVITHPAGAVERLGHHHLIVANGYAAEFLVQDEDLVASHFSFSTPVRELVIDPPEVIRYLFPRLRSLGLVDRELPTLSADERATMRERIASPAQLGAENSPLLRARVEQLTTEGGSLGDHDFPQRARLSLTIRGKRVTREIPMAVRRTRNEVLGTAVGEFRFSEFGIEPFQSALGLLRNEDKFHVYVEVAARRME